MDVHFSIQMNSQVDIQFWMRGVFIYVIFLVNGGQEKEVNLGIQMEGGRNQVVSFSFAHYL